jgi:chromosome segregation ATPase
LPFCYVANGLENREASMGGEDIAVEILKEIRDELRVLRADTNERFGAVESSLFDLTEHQHEALRQARTTSRQDERLEARFRSLETRVDKLESK